MSDATIMFPTMTVTEAKTTDQAAVTNTASTMFPSMVSGVKPADQGTGFLTNPPAPKPAATTVPEIQTTESANPADVLFREGGDPPADGNYSDALSGFFYHRELGASYNQQNDLLEELQESRKAMQEILVDCQVGKSGANELLCLAGEYSNYPKSGEALEALTARCQAEFEQAYGDQLPQVLAGARRIYAEIQAKIPAITEYVDAGLGSDPKFIRHLIQAAKSKGYFIPKRG